MEAVAAYHAGRPDQAEKLFRKVARRQPNDVDAQRMIGFLCSQTDRHTEAVDRFDVVLRLNPKQPQIHYLRGISFLALKRFQDALDSFNAALVIDGPQPDTYANRGAALQRLERLSEAIESYDRAIALDPTYVLAHTHKASALEDQGRLAEALASYDNSLKIQPTSDAWWGRCTVLQLMRRFDEALFASKHAYALEPSRPYLQGEILGLKMQLGDWDNFAQDCELVLRGVDKGLAVAMPGCILLLPSSAEQQRRAAEIYARDKFPAQPPPPPPHHVLSSPGLTGRSSNHRPGILDCQSKSDASDFDHLVSAEVGQARLRVKPGNDAGRVGARERAPRPAAKPKIAIGYFSCDFRRDHPVSRLAVRLFEHHDRDSFTVFGFSFGAQHDNEFARQLAGAMDRFIDVSSMSDQDVASLSRSLGVDIAVDLTGLTFSTRLGIFAHRAAPVQATYLGYPGTTGCSFIDYVIADEVAIPSGDAGFFSERPFHLPVSFQVNDSKRPPVDEPRPRAAYGLPEQGFVYCCFNNGCKVTPDVFAIWMRLLQRVQGSVLWLVGDTTTFARNLRRRAQESGVAPERLVFAERVNVQEYLSRQRCADLALDTFYYNGGTTTSDALWAGLPVVTRKGTTFAGRMAASLLQAIGLPDLIAGTAEEYEELAFRLATERELLDSIKQQLVRNRSTSSLFDTAAFTKNLEAAYRTMVARSG
jgi:predicted O-linked N-acetylglucosamine transferase (SPINDLY family)